MIFTTTLYLQKQTWIKYNFVAKTETYIKKCEVKKSLFNKTQDKKQPERRRKVKN